MKENLLTVRKYAESMGFSVGYVYQQITKKKVKCVIISGVKFIEVK